jgi:hypothetical protein
VEGDERVWLPEPGRTIGIGRRLEVGELAGATARREPFRDLLRFFPDVRDENSLGRRRQLVGEKAYLR